MIKYALECLNRSEKDLKRELKNILSTRSAITYELLIETIVKTCFPEYSPDKITILDDCDYDGTIMAIFSREIFCPNCSDYLMTYIDYGSCSACDTLFYIMDCSENKEKDLYKLCVDIISNTIKPYNFGWRYDPNYDPVEYKFE